MLGLRITWRCWTDDLGRAKGELPRPEAIADEHVVVREFLSSRRQRPEGTEGHVLALGPAFRKLKASRERATTLYEAQPLEVDFQDPELPFPGVVWLVAYGYRKEGDADDAYRGFERIGADAMRPVEEDYALLAEDLRLEAELSLRRDLEDGLRRLRDKARGEPGVLHRLDLDTVQPGVAFLIFEDGDLTLLIVPVVDSNRRPVSQEVQALMISVVFDGLRLDELDAPAPEVVERIAGYRLRPFEFAICRRRSRPDAGREAAAP